MQGEIHYPLEGQRLALATDFDGTVSTITPNPQLARIEPGCRDSLAKLSDELVLVAVLSGRQVEEARQLSRLPGVVYIGNHGLERWEKDDRYAEPLASKYASVIHTILERARRELKLPGLLFEDKGIRASIHYRSAQGPAAARKASEMRPNASKSVHMPAGTSPGGHSSAPHWRNCHSPTKD